MPRYDYRCEQDHATEQYVAYAQRQEPQKCGICGQPAFYQFPLTAVNGFQPFEAYYDEGLDANITGRRHRQQEMQARGLREAGDRIHGARNWDESAPTRLEKQAPRAIKAKKPLPPSEFIVDGQVVKANELPDVGKDAGFRLGDPRDALPE